MIRRAIFCILLWLAVGYRNAEGDITPQNASSPESVNILTGNLKLGNGGGLTTLIKNISGQDTKITAHVINNGATALGPLWFTGITATFAAVPTGTLQTRGDVSISPPDAKWYPSLANPLGCVTAHDAVTGISVYAPSEAGRQSLFNANFIKDGVLPNPLGLSFYTTHTLAPGAVCDVTIIIRQTTDLTPAGLLSGYKSSLPPLAFIPSAQPAVQMASVDPSSITLADPYGFNGDTRRFDLPSGVMGYVNWIGPLAKSAKCGSVIFWGLQGAPAMKAAGVYPPKFDEFPPAIQKNLPALRDGLAFYGLRMGLCASGYCVDVTSSSSVSAYLARYAHAKALGFSDFYIDTFGGDFAAAQLMPQIRKVLGPSAQLYPENCSDQTLIYGGRYTEVSPNGISWVGPEQLKHLQYLFASPWLCIKRGMATIPPGMVPLYQDAELPRLLATSLRNRN